MTVFYSFIRLFCLVMVSCTLPLSAATLFTENYTGETIGQGTGTWRGYNTISVAGTSYGGVGITTGATAPSGETGNHYLYAQNNTPSGATTTVDYFLFSSAATSSASLFTDLVPADFSEFSASWQQNVGGGMTGMSYYFAVQVDSAWYATSSFVTDGSLPNLRTLDLLDSDWYAVSFLEGTSMALDTSGTPLTSDSLFGSGDSITGLGFYIKNLPGANVGPPSDYRTIRFDNLTIAGAPEPSRVFLLTFSLGAIGFRRRRSLRVA
ncbi:MAG: PEP-CTERM sorting domain-containing protein [Prosthecobacter sp.]|nr:PEP-CTERM sorting domain-containing protein [Prosthecobacter sp.]